MSDPFKVLSEYQHLIRNQVTDKKQLNYQFFSHLKALSSAEEHQGYFAALPPSLKAVYEVLMTTIKYIEHRLNKNGGTAKKVNNNCDLDIVRV